MIKKSIWIFTMLLAIGGISVYTYGEWHGFTWMEKKSKQEVLQYLKDMGEKEEEMKSIVPSYDNKSGHYYVTVVFKDEQGLRYEFIYRNKKTVFIGRYDDGNNTYDKGKHLQ